MRTFCIDTFEKWEHKVGYTVQADSLEAAVKMIRAGQVEYNDAEVVEGGDEVLYVDFATDDDGKIEIPPHLAKEQATAIATAIERAIRGIDWALLRRQKEWLVSTALPSHSAAGTGLIELLDCLQDAAVEDGIATEIEVFGNS